ncbi:MAG: hypothetical protein JST51_15805 [Armatimonadetes bacterium]|nr:hypothetical protein [Armatimonadota bacterium]
MDDFDFGMEPAELSTSAMNFSFGAAGKISSLWVAESGGAYGGDQQFISGPIVIGDETSDEYVPGTILLGTRTDIEDPWIVSRNTGGDPQVSETQVDIDYDFSLLSDLTVKGKFYEDTERPGVVIWEITIRNKSRQSVEIGELGFPLALNTSLEGFPISDEGMNSLLTERLIVQKHIGGAGSYLVAKKVCGDPPGLLVFPGKDTSFEFFHSAPLSMRLSPGWSGIPILYVHSQATIEREDWGEWFFDHTSLVMEPKEEKTFQICFAPVLARHGYDVPLALAEYGVPTFRPIPGAVVPTDVTLAVEVSGTRPAEFLSDDEAAELDSESDEFGGTVLVRSPNTGQNRIVVKDMDGREAWAHIYVVKPIKDLIESRASWICRNQVMKDGPFEHAIVPADLSEETKAVAEFDNSWAIISSLADATFLAEKNRIYFDPDQVKVLDDYIEKFLLQRFHKPGQGTFGAICPPWKDSIAMDGSRAQLYVLAAKFYVSCADLATGARLSRVANDYLELARELLVGMLKFADREGYVAQTLYGANELFRFDEWADLREGFLEKTRLPFWNGRYFSLTTLSEVSVMAELTNSMSATGSVEQLCLAHKSSSPNWWSFGAEPRPSVDYEAHLYLPDYAEVFPSYTSVSSSMAMTTWLKRDYTRLDEAGLRLATGGMLAPWSLVREDGALTMGFCPDLGSSQRGIVNFTGDAGFALADYLRYSTGYLLSSFDRGFVPLGVHFESYPRDGMTIIRLEPWDGVGRRIMVRHLNLSVEVEGAKIDVIEFDVNLRWAKVTLDNPTETMKRKTRVLVDGLWGTKFVVTDADSKVEDGVLVLDAVVDAGRLKEIEIRVV